MWWVFLLGATAASAPAVPPSRTVNGVRYGKQEILSGQWFTNFENSRFAECDDAACDWLTQREQAAITCTDGECDKLDREARRLTHNTGPTAPEGSFGIRFVGRRGLVRHKSRFLGDGERDVLIERLLEIRQVDR